MIHIKENQLGFLQPIELLHILDASYLGIMFLL